MQSRSELGVKVCAKTPDCIVHTQAASKVRPGSINPRQLVAPLNPYKKTYLPWVFEDVQIGIIMNGISQTTTTTPHSLMRETSEDSEKTIPPRQIDFSKWVKGYDGETTSNERRVWEDRPGATDPESDNETCMDLSFGEILDVDCFTPPKLPTDDLVRLIEVTREGVQSNYRKILNRLQNLTMQPIPQLQPQPTSNEECDLMTDDQSDLDHQGSSPRQAVRRREDDPELSRSDRRWNLVEPLLSRITDREWSLVEPLSNKEVKAKGSHPRRTLNSVLFILINGISTPLPKNLNFCTRWRAKNCFFVWQANKVLEEVLSLLEKESEEPLKSYYLKLLKKLQKILKPISISNFNKKFGQAGSGFQGVTDKQWILINPLLNSRRYSRW